MYTIIKERLVVAIKGSKLTKTQIAKAINVTPEMVTQYCTTKKLPRLDTFAQLCKVLNVSADYLLGLAEIDKSLSDDAD